MIDLPDTLSPTLAARARTAETATMDGPIEGEWDDVEWRSIAARRFRTPAQNVVVGAGPRAHPFGPAAVVVREKDEPVRTFASKDVYEAWASARAAQAAPPAAPAQPSPVAVQPVVVAPALALPVAVPVKAPVPAA